MKRLLALTESSDFVCYRYRIEAFRDALAARGWQLEALPRPRTNRGFVRQLPRIAAADAVVLQRRLLCWWKRRMLRQAAKILLYDFDDAVFQRDSNCHRPAGDARRWQRFQATIRMADASFAGNRHLCEQAERCAGSSAIHFMPTCVDPSHYRAAQHARVGSEAQLVWVGSQSTLHSLQSAQAGLLNAATRLPGLTFKAICDVFPTLAGVRVVPSPWSSATEAEDIASADIGLAWLPEHSWSLGKCGLKVLQYMAAGLPVVANSLGVHRALVVDGETGFLVTTPEECGAAIQRLAESPQLRRQMGQAGRARLVEQYSVESWAGPFVDVVDRLADGPVLRAAA